MIPNAGLAHPSHTRETECWAVTWDLLKLVECAGLEIGFSHPAIRLLSFLVRRTDPRDWESTAPEPVCYLSQCAIADALRLDSRSVRRAERELIELGAIHKQSRGDGHRGCLRGSAGVLHVFGLNLAPLIAFYKIHFVEGAFQFGQRRS